MRDLLLDDTVKGIFKWFYISVCALTGVAILWLLSIGTFWMLPEVSSDPDFPGFIGILLRLCIWSVGAAGWSFLGVLCYRWLEDAAEKYLEKY